MHDSFGKLPKKARLSINALAGKIGADVLSLPIYAFHPDQESIEALAFTRYNGIFLNQSLLEVAPHEAGAVVAHEILHHVVDDPLLAAKYPHELMNYAEDMKINQLLEDLWGYDVRKLTVPGLRNPKWDHLTLEQLLKKLSTKDIEYQHPVVTAQIHPLMRNVADRLRNEIARTSLGKLLNIKVNDPLYSVTTQHETELLKRHLATFNRLELHNLPGVDVNRALWELSVRLYEAGSIPNKLGQGLLNHTDATVLAPKLSSFNDTYGDSEFACFSAKFILKKLGQSDALLKQEYQKLWDKMLRVKASIMKRATKSKKKKSLQKRMVRIRSLRPLDDLLLQNKLPEYRTSKSAKGITAQFSNKEPKLRVVKGQFTETTDFTMRFTLKELTKIKDVYDRLSKLTDGQEQEGEGNNSGEEKKDKPNSNKEQATAGKEAGKDKGKPQKLEALEAVELNYEKLGKIFRYADDFLEKIVGTTSKRPDEISQSFNTINYGSDLERVIQSEVALLANEDTKLAFFAKLVDSELLSEAATLPKRSPLIIAVDGSGSMQGAPYERAAGFSLAMYQRLQEQRRGFALLNFSTDIDQIMVSNGGKANLMEALKVLTTPSYGGTSFNVVIQKASEIIRENRWKRTQILVVTDGYDSLSPEVVRQLPNGTKLTAIIVGGMDQNLAHFHETLKCKNVGELTGKLVKVGQSIV